VPEINSAECISVYLHLRSVHGVITD